MTANLYSSISRAVKVTELLASKADCGAFSNSYKVFFLLHFLPGLNQTQTVVSTISNIWLIYNNSVKLLNIPWVWLEVSLGSVYKEYRLIQTTNIQ